MGEPVRGFRRYAVPCPKCGKRAYNTGNMFMSLPPLVQFICESCGHEFSLREDLAHGSEIDQEGEGK